jgi:DnaJ-class molecular chaperone
LSDHRQKLLDARRTEWMALIQRHWDKYKNLHVTAGFSRTGETPCTICDDSFLKFCLLCDSSNNGQCPECHGKGRLHSDEICPACSATGKCFMCAGTGKMPCPFCDQRGMIYHASPPPSFVPIPL